LISVALCPKSQNGRSDSYQQCGGTSLCISWLGMKVGFT
jgi:hypothetical protein